MNSFAWGFLFGVITVPLVLTVALRMYVMWDNHQKQKLLQAFERYRKRGGRFVVTSITTDKQEKQQ